MIPGSLSLPIADALTLHCQVRGGGMPVLLLHGLLGSSANLANIARQLAGSYQVLSVDLRNHGRSPHSQRISYALMIADVIALLDSHGIECCAVLGHSMGGKVAMGLALTRPRRVQALVVVDICPIDYPGDRNAGIIEALRQVPLDALETRKQVDDWLAPAVTEASMRQFLLTNLYRGDHGYGWRANLSALADNHLALASAPTNGGCYRGPSLFVKGGQSDYIGPKCERAIRELFPAAELKIIADAGHWPHAEKPVLFNALVSRFLYRHYPLQEGGG
jgi:esterase